MLELSSTEMKSKVQNIAMVIAQFVEWKVVHVMNQPFVDPSFTH